ncbi:MAG: tetratricopeptide repeat protein [Acidobacteriaceae bacterium]|nr:tetratricopeptide repeat protein [Acidobacteriaceae bacterium]MBV9780814.1 tetratricopeptide repeat protein [Acidobacteriaceae bacterium]
MELTPQQWENVKALFEIALEKSPPERTAFLAEASPDSLVRREVERLLAHHVESGGFLSSPAVPGSASPGAPAHSQSFLPGDFVAERFRITRFLARGGMGEVYEAEDLDLRERVALKFIRSELLDDTRALERFKREVHLARQVTHPNVCRIFDLFRQPASAVGVSRGPVVFVAMELLEGETLAEFLRRKPLLRIDEARPIALQMAAGLGAAHSAGVLHRDFKPGNVVLVSGAKGVRAVVTDFGLALRSDHESSLEASFTAAGELLGTPAYMSPEQVEGKELTPASDVYSLGLVLYQMVTGTRAFEAATPLSMAVRRTKEDPAPPRTLVPDLDRRWEAVILRCLAREPKARFQTGDEVAEVLRTDAKHHRTRSLQPRAALVSLALILVIVGAVLIPRISHRVSISTGAPPTKQSKAFRPSVAVLPLRNLSGKSETEWVSTAVSEMLNSELAAGGKLRTFPGENIARASADLGLTGKQTLAPDTLARLRKYLGSEYVVLGSYLDQGSPSEAQVRIDLWLQDSRTGEIAATVSEKGSESNLDDLATRAGTDLRQRLGIGEIAPGEAALVRASLPSNAVAVRLYSEGLAKLRVMDAAAARDLLERAVAADPNYALGHSALADAWAAMGYDQKAQEESKKARDLSSGLSREERLWIEGKDWELNRKWDRAVEIYRTLFEFFPDNIEYGLRLANAQKQARTVDEALATLEVIRRLPPPERNDPRIALGQADVFDIKGAYKEQQAAAESAASRARDLGATLLLARALCQEARSFEKQGKLDEALRRTQEAARISESAGERAEMAKALTITGIVRFDQGNFSEAANAYHRALAIQRAIGDMRGAASTLNDLANVLGQQGELSGSIQMLNEALRIFREVGDKHSAAAVLGSIAARTLQEGDLRQGKKMLEEGLAASREIQDQERTSTALYNLGEVLRWQGDLKGARKMYEQAEDLSRHIGDQSGVAYALFSLGDIATAEGDLPAARGRYSESMTLRTRIGEKGNVAETQMALALLLIEEGHAREAENTLREIREEFRKEGLGDDEILADLLLARALVSQQKVADAEHETSAVQHLLAKSQDFSVRLRASILQATVQAAAGRREDAVRILEDSIEKAKRFGYVGFQLEAQLALGEVQTASGNAVAGRSLLEDVRKQAQLKGFRLIANKASRALAKSATA